MTIFPFAGSSLYQCELCGDTLPSAGCVLVHMIVKHRLALCKEQHTLGTLATFAWQEIARLVLKQRLTNCEEISEADDDKNSEYSDEVLPDDDKTKDKVLPVKLLTQTFLRNKWMKIKNISYPQWNQKPVKNSKKRDSQVAL